jgi:hypothetical protein
MANTHCKNLTWTEKLETLISSCEFIFMEDKTAVESILDKDYAPELEHYLQLDAMGLSATQKGWTMAIFLYVLKAYSKGEKVGVNQMLNLMSTGLSTLTLIEEAIRFLEVRRLFSKRVTSHRPGADTILEVNTSAINKVLRCEPLPGLTLEAIHARKLLLQYRDAGFDLSEYFKKEPQNFIDNFLTDHSFKFIPTLDSYKTISHDMRYLMILLIIKYLSVEGSDRDGSESNITISATTIHGKMLLENKCVLSKLGFIHNEHNDFLNEVYILLSNKAISTFNLDQKKSAVRERPGGKSTPPPNFNDNSEDAFFKVIPYNKIEPEELFYNAGLSQQLDFYKNLLEKDDKVYKHNKAIKGRIILMFDGTPGTGKTAAAQQLALQTKRPLVHVNWQTFRGQFVGQSEKNLKSMLDDIDSMALKNRRVPIVLFNEAEAFLSQRIAISQSTDRMENNLVSLLLEWLEKKSPFCIVIFTSNHRQLMDKAFERRISHINFDAPDADTRLNIWKDLLVEKTMSDTDYLELAQHELSGAEIAQVLKTYHLHKIAYNMEGLDLSLIHQLCGSQRWMEQKTSIGFKQ